MSSILEQVVFANPFARSIVQVLLTLAIGVFSGTMVAEITEVRDGVATLNLSRVLDTYSLWALFIVGCLVGSFNVLEAKYSRRIERNLDPNFRRAVLYQAHLKYIVSKIEAGRPRSFMSFQELLERAEGRDE